MQADFAEELSRIQSPTLIVWGDADPLCPRATQEELSRAIAGAQLIVYQDAGHAMHWEEPARFAADLVAFARTLSDRSETAARAVHASAPAAA